MNYVKKMCILRQIKQGFSGDGKSLSGLVKIEQYGNNLAIEVSIINFAPLRTGEYYCLLSDGKGKTEMLSLRGKSMFNILSDIDVTGGFCAIICYVKNDVVPIAYGINGNGSYDWRTILNATLPPVFPKEKPLFATEDPVPKQNPTDFIPTPPPKYTQNPTKDRERITFNDSASSASSATELSREENAVSMRETKNYDDEKIVMDNYYKEGDDEQDVISKNRKDAYVESALETSTPSGTTSAKNGNAKSIFHPFKTDGDGYYQSVKSELDELFKTYPKDDTLSGAFSCSEWVRVKGTAKNPQYLVGVLYEDGRARYICYALATQDKNNPPTEIQNVCSFVPISTLSENIGFFVIFQSATGGECVKPEEI